MKPKRIYDTLEEVRKARGLSWYRVAQQTGINASAFTRWGKTGQNPDLESLWRLADFFGMTIDQLAGRIPVPAHPASTENVVVLTGREKRALDAYRRDPAVTTVVDRLIAGAPAREPDEDEGEGGRTSHSTPRAPRGGPPASSRRVKRKPVPSRDDGSKSKH